MGLRALNCARCPWNRPDPETDVDVGTLMRTASLLDAGFAVPVDALSPREQEAFWIVRDELREQGKRRQPKPPHP